MGWVVTATPRPLDRRKRPDTHCVGAWVGPRAGLDECVKSRPPPGILSQDCPTRSESLYRLSYLGPLYIHIYVYTCVHVYVYVCVYIYVYMFCVCVYVCMYIYVYMFCVCVCMYVYIYIHIHAYIIHTYMHTHVNTRTYIHTVIHTY
jgi:hypothetical protein